MITAKSLCGLNGVGGVSRPDDHRLRDVVARQLDLMSAPGGLLNTASSHATVELYRGSPDRAAFRAEVIERYREIQQDVAADGLAAIMMAGPPGAGKSTARAHRNVAGWRVLDADIIKTFLIERAVQDGIYTELLHLPLPDGRTVMPGELAPLVHQESTELLDALRADCMRDGENIMIDGTLTWRPERGPGYGAILMDELARAGYGDVEIIDVEVPKHVAIDRALTRWWNDRVSSDANSFGGRYVPPAAIEAVYLPGGGTKSQLNADEAFACPAANEIDHLVLTVRDQNSMVIRQLVKDTGNLRTPTHLQNLPLPSSASPTPKTRVSNERSWVQPHIRRGRRVEGYWRSR